MRQTAALLFLLSVLVPAGVSAAPDAGAADIDLSAFIADMDRLAAAFAEADPSAAAGLVQNLPRQWRVQVGGQRVDIGAAWIARSVRTGSSDPAGWRLQRRAIVRRLLSLRAEAADLDRRSSAAKPADDARSALHAVLARPEFQQNLASLWRERLQERLAEGIDGLLRRLGLGRLGGRGTAILLAWAASLAALALLIAGLVRAFVRASRETELQIGSAAARPAPAREYALRALTQARTGDFRAAVRCAYHAVLLHFDEQGVWRVDEAWTPREYLRQLPTHDARRGRFADSTARFEQIWYGRREATGEDTERLFGHLEELGCLRAAERTI